jgi:ketosteroid isomerase-like protein
MSGSSKAQLARRAWDAIARGDAGAVRALLAPDVVWHALARGAPWAGEHRGADVILDFLARVGEVTDVFDAQLVDVLAGDERVLVVFHVRIGVGDRHVELDYLLLARATGDRVTEVWTTPLDPAALERLWEEPGVAARKPR